MNLGNIKPNSYWLFYSHFRLGKLVFKYLRFATRTYKHNIYGFPITCLIVQYCLSQCILHFCQLII